MLAFGCLLAGCATGDERPVAVAHASAPSQERPSFIAIDDPWEGLNRRTYAFNALADRWVLVPVVDVYTEIVPWPFRDRVADFFANIGNLVTFANQVLQLELGEAGKTALRFGANSLLGMFGLVDIASQMGLPKYDEDFGKTLGHWGLAGGPYLVLPILGPSNVRDTVGTVTDTVAFSQVDPFGASSIQTRYPPILAADVVNARYKQPFRYYESGSPFEYDLVRFLYTKKREIESGTFAPIAAPPGGEDGSP